MTQLLERPAVREHPSPEVEVAPPEEGRPGIMSWMAWILAVVMVAAAGWFIWYAVSSSGEEAVTPYQEDFTGVDEFVATSSEPVVVGVAFQEDFTGLDELAASQSAAEVGETPFQEDFAGLDDYVGDRIRSGISDAPFLEDFGGLGE